MAIFFVKIKGEIIRYCNDQKPIMLEHSECLLEYFLSAIRMFNDVKTSTGIEGIAQER